LILCNILLGQIHFVVISVSWLIAWIKSCLIENSDRNLNWMVEKCHIKDVWKTGK